MTLHYKVKKYTLAGKSINWMCHELGLGYDKVVCVQVRLGLREEEPIEPGEREEADRAQLHSEVLGLLADGIPDREIMERHGVSAKELRAIRRELMAMPEMKGMPISHWHNVGCGNGSAVGARR